MAKKTEKKESGEKEGKAGAKGAKEPALLHCTYAGQDYSPGSNVEMPGAGGVKVTKSCNGSSGAWDPVT